ncbi:MAG: hypothetical protein MKZ70_08495 [Opitutales bacterium]|nr:hypothetical protein [Opitutales bacterium]
MSAKGGFQNTQSLTILRPNDDRDYAPTNVHFAYSLIALCKTGDRELEKKYNED